MTKLNINRKQAQDLVNRYISDPITKLHSIETEAIMRSLAKKLGKDEEEWGIIGLLHDIDWDLTKNDPKKHCIVCQELLKEVGASDFLINSVISHGYSMDGIPELQNKQRSSEVEHCLVAAETLTGLIIASALMKPDKKLSSLTLESLTKKFKTKKFAEKCNRELILECEKAGFPLDEFLSIGLFALQQISSQLGL
jgi:putative nucleotidyltransferase with HDIG domain